MDTTTILVIIVVAIIIIVGAAIYLSRRSRRVILHAPPPAYEESEPAPQPEPPVNRSAEGLFPPPEPPSVLPGAPPVPSAAPAVPPAAPAASLPAPAPVAAKPVAVPTEDVRFTAYFPKEVTVETWYTLLVYAHVEAALGKVQADAARFKDEMGQAPKEAHSAAPAQLARGTEITIIPNCDGVIFNPERVTFKWVEDVQRADFRLQAVKELAGLAGNLTVNVFVGPLIVATIRGGMAFNEASSTAPAANNPVQATAAMYRSEQIFVSYSHADEDIVIACRNTYAALGWQVLRDRDSLRPGEDWDARLLELIDQADLFQLFWSENSAKSAACKKEWDHALDLEHRQVKGADFIRPVYWKQPWVPPPDDLAKIHFVYAPLPGGEKP